MSYIGNTSTTQAFTPAVDYFNGNGSTTAFTLSRPVASVAQVQAVIENVPQNPGSAYTVSGNTVTFTSAPPSGTQNIYVYYTSPINQVIAPGQGTVGPTALTAGAPSWSVLGGVTLPRIDSTNEGGQINFNRASDDTAVWAIDSFGSTSTPTLRFINGATVAASIDGSNRVGFSGASSTYGAVTFVGAKNGWSGINFNSTAGTNVGTLMVTDGFGGFYNSADNAWLGYFTTSGMVLGSSTLLTPSGSAPMYSARAWVNFNGTGTVAIRASGNVSSITDNGTGDYTVNFSTAMSDSSYSWSCGGNNSSDAAATNSVLVGLTQSSYQTASSFRFVSKQSSGGGGMSNTDFSIITANFIR